MTYVTIYGHIIEDLSEFVEFAEDELIKVRKDDSFEKVRRELIRKSKDDKMIVDIVIKIKKCLFSEEKLLVIKRKQQKPKNEGLQLTLEI